MTKRMRFSIWIEADPTAIWEYLTEPEHLTRWFCDHATVDLPGGVYEFWGRSTPEAVNEPKSTLLNFEEARLLRYRWNVTGHDTLVHITLAPTNQGTSVEIVNEGYEAWRSGRLSLDDFWGLALEHLRLYAHGEREFLLPDFTQPATDIRIDSLFNAPSSEVFRGLTEPEVLDKVIATKAEVDLREGGTLSYGWGAGPSTILELVPDEQLTVRWQVEETGPDTIVTWTLNEENGRTRLTLVHNGFGARTGRDHIAGWAMYLARLRALLLLGDRWERVRREVIAEPSQVEGWRLR